MRPSEGRERAAAAAVSLGLIGLTFGWWGTHDAAALTSPQFVTAYGTALTLCAVFTGILLIWRARLIGDASSARIAAAFVYCVPLVTAYALTYPGVVPGLSSQQEGSGWAWFGWRIGWALALTWYAVGRPRWNGNLRRSMIVALASSCGVVVLAFSGKLPDWYDPVTRAHLPPVFVAYGITVAVTAVALVCLLRMKPLTTINAWLTVPLIANLVVGVLGMVNGARFGGLADASRLLAVVSAGIVVWALVSEFARLLTRASSLDRFMTMAQYASNIVYLLDARGACIYMNPRWTETTGQPVEEALSTDWMHLVQPDDLVRTGPERAGGLASGQRYEYEVRYRSVDDSYRWHLVSKTPTFDSAGELDGWYAVATDIDAQHRAHEQLAELYAREHHIAQTLQSAFIPPFLPQVAGLRFQAVYRPALREPELGGDWYDVFVLHDGRIVLSIGDVSGHGVDAAIAMVRLRETLRAVTGFNDSDPGLILQMADRAFAGTHPETIATVALAIYDPLTRRLVRSSAGHPAPVLFRDGVTTFLNAGLGLPLGVQSDSTFVSETHVLENGDTLVFYTDGLIEGDRDMIAGERRLAGMLARHADDAEQIVTGTLRGEQRDDVALLTLSLLGSGPRTSWHFQADDATSATDARIAFVSHLQNRGIDPELVMTAERVFGELVANVVRHAPGPIEIDLTWRDDEPFLAVRDRGPCFEAASVTLPEDPFAECGRGFFIIANTASPPVVTPRPGGGNEVVVALVKSVLQDNIDPSAKMSPC